MARLWSSADPGAGNSAASTRDRDLISTDEYLKDDTLDNLWTWFCKDGVDPQLVFVKIINSVNIYYSTYISN